jgi:hypothetical protein
MELKPSQFTEAFEYLLSKDQFRLHNNENEIGLKNENGDVVLSKSTVGMDSRYFAYKNVRTWIENHLVGEY